MLAGRSFEADRRGDDKLGAGRLQSNRKLLPIFHREHQSEMWDWNVLPIDRIASASNNGVGNEMSDDLVATQVEIDPLVCAAPFRTAQKLPVEPPRGSKIIDGEREMERRQAHATSNVIACVGKQSSRLWIASVRRTTQ